MLPPSRSMPFRRRPRFRPTHTICASGYGTRNTRRKEVERNADPTTRQKSPIKNLCRVPPVWRGGGRKGSITCRISPVLRGGQERALRQIDHRKGTMTRRALVDMAENTGANTREKSCEKPPAGHRHGGGLDEETTNTRDGRWQHLQPR